MNVRSAGLRDSSEVGRASVIDLQDRRGVAACTAIPEELACLYIVLKSAIVYRISLWAA